MRKFDFYFNNIFIKRSRGSEEYKDRQWLGTHKSWKNDIAKETTKKECRMKDIAK